MVEYSLVRSKRKTVSLEITESLIVLVRAPLKMSAEKIDAFVSKHNDWIEKHLKIAQERREREAELELSDSEIKQLKKPFLRLIIANITTIARIITSAIMPLLIVVRS